MALALLVTREQHRAQRSAGRGRAKKRGLTGRHRGSGLPGWPSSCNSLNTKGTRY